MAQLYVEARTASSVNRTSITLCAVGAAFVLPLALYLPPTIGNASRNRKTADALRGILVERLEQDAVDRLDRLADTIPTLERTIEFVEQLVPTTAPPSSDLLSV